MLMVPEKKFPVEVSCRFLKFIRYRFGKTPRLILEPVRKKKKPSLEKGACYWLPEKYRIVQTATTKTIQYYSDFYKNEEPKWVEATKMKKSFARYSLECVAIETKKLKNIGKKEIINTGVFNEIISQKIDKKISEEFRKKPIEVWRFAYEWDLNHENGEKWLNNPEVYMYGVVIHRLEPEYEDYRLRNWGG